MERCDENNKIYSRQRTTTKYTRAAANMFSTSKEGVSNAKPYCPSQACTFTASHPGVRTTKTHRRYSLKSLSKLSRFPCCFKAPWSLLFILACATLPARWVTPDSERKYPLIASWAFPRTSWGSQVLLKSPSHSTRNSMLPCSSFRLDLMDCTPHSWSSAIAFMRCVCKHIAVSVDTHYHDPIVSMYHHSQTFAKFKSFQWKS